MSSKISVIGAGGRMGDWFIRYLLNNNFKDLNLYDTNPKSIRQYPKVIIHDNLRDCLSDSDIVIFCVPLIHLPKIVAKCKKLMKSSSILIEISSLKSPVIRSLKALPKHIHPISIHPMFGSGADLNSKLKILLIPVRNKSLEKRSIKKLFPNSKILLISDYKEHDQLMSVILGLTHYVNIVLGDFLSEKKCNILNSYSGTTFRIQKLLINSIFADDPELISTLIMDNSYVKMEIKKFNKFFEKYNKIIFSGEKNLLKTELIQTKSSMKKYRDFDKSYQQLYKFVNNLEEK